MRAFGHILMVIFFVIAFVGWTYFGPPQYTQYVTKTDFFRYYGPYLDKLFAMAGAEGVVIGQLYTKDGDVRFRPRSEMNYFQATEGQRFFGETAVSTGDSSIAMITLPDGSEILLDENTTVLLGTSAQGDDDLDLVSIKLEKGVVNAVKKEDSVRALQIQYRGSDGKVHQVSRKGLVAMRPKPFVDPRLPDAMREAQEVKEIVSEGEKLNQQQIVQKRENYLREQRSKMEARQKELEKAAQRAEERRLAAVRQQKLQKQAATQAEERRQRALAFRKQQQAAAKRRAELIAQKRLEQAKRLKAQEELRARQLVEAEKNRSRQPASTRLKLKKRPGKRWVAPPEGNDLSKAVYGN